MGVLIYIKRVLEIYAGGGDDELCLALVEGQDHEDYAFARNTERLALAVATLLGDGRMSPANISSNQEAELVLAVEGAVTCAEPRTGAERTKLIPRSPAQGSV